MNRSCLVVDDSAMIRKIARKVLQTLDFEVSEAENGLIAEQMCATAMPDAVLLDWNMPEVSGIEFLYRLRKMHGGSVPKVIFCTTEDDVEHIQEAFQAGADEYLMKPFDKALLQAKLLSVTGAVGHMPV